MRPLKCAQPLTEMILSCHQLGARKCASKENSCTFAPTAHKGRISKCIAAQKYLKRTFATNSTTKTPSNNMQQLYVTEQRGCLFHDSFRIYLKTNDGIIISPFHDIPLKVSTKGDMTYNMIVEVPRWSNAKMEICTKEKMNPIKQDVNNGELRFVANCFPFKGYLWNYGALPQTWENPDHVDPLTGTKGDSDPIDICEIGTKVHETGTVVQVKVLGILALIDEGETDWKIIGIDVTDPLAPDLRDIEDVEKVMPGLLQSTVHWYKMYKTPFGSPPNTFAFDGEIRNKKFAKEIVNQVHQQWMQLIKGEVSTDAPSVERSCTSIVDAPTRISAEEAQLSVDAKPLKGKVKDIDDTLVNKWYYLM